jgi:positive regulator of sigma E activity
MLEIIGIYFASRTIGELASSKGYSSGLYRFLTFLFWFVFEVVGAVIGLLLFGNEGFLFYIFALVGAVCGFLLLKTIVNRLPNKNTFEEEVID